MIKVVSGDDVQKLLPPNYLISDRGQRFLVQRMDIHGEVGQPLGATFRVVLDDSGPVRSTPSRVQEEG